MILSAVPSIVATLVSEGEYTSITLSNDFATLLLCLAYAFASYTIFALVTELVQIIIRIAKKVRKEKTIK